ncbi:MAG: DUF4153 domain-containing protein [Bacillota bacterium]|jgi:hypothetical protein
MLLSGLFCLAIKQYHKKVILFHFIFDFLFCFCLKAIALAISFFWLAAVLLTGISYSFWTNNGLEPWRSMFLFFSAVYWVICATGLPLLGETSNWFGLDSINGLFVIPFRNFGCHYRSLAFLGSNKRAQGRQIFSIGLGLVLTLIIAGLVLPLLMEADSGGFSKLTKGFLTYFQGIRQEVFELIENCILAIPIAAYLFGLVAGSAHKRGCSTFIKDRTLKTISVLQVLPMTTVYTLLGLLCSLYVVFIGSQLPYYFSAFVGERPEGWQIYSEYARRGFFELCRIAAINLFVLTTVNLLSKKPNRNSLILKVLNSLLALLTLVLIATALSKMAMYIGAYGLSIRRLLPCFFMIFLSVICGGVIVLQKWHFSIVRLAAGVGVVMICTLCLLDADSFVARYNANRYLSRTLNNFDVAILYQSGPAGVEPAWEVYQKTNDQVLQDKLKTYLLIQNELAAESSGQPGDNLQKARARQITAGFAD